MRAPPKNQPAAARACLSGVEHFAQHVRQNAAVAHVLDFFGRVDSRQYLELARVAAVVDPYGELLAPRDARRQPFDRVALAPRKPEALARLAVGELQRQHAHPDQVAAMDPLEALRDYRPHAEQLRALGGPIARASRAILLARDHDQ